MRRSAFLLPLFLAMGVALSSCGTFSKDVPQHPCPQVLILNDAGHLVRFKPGTGRDITDIQFQAAISNFVGSCEYVKNGVNVDLKVLFAVQRGAASSNPKVSFDYFVALPSFMSNPAGKKIFPVSGTFPDNKSQMIYQDEISMFLPLKNDASGPDQKVVLGFQLTPGELKYNRARNQY